MISDNPLPFSYNLDGSISAVTPPGETYESVPVTLTTVGGTHATGGAAQFTYIQGTPSVTVSPDNGPPSALTGVYVYGSDFVPGENSRSPTPRTSAKAGSRCARRWPTWSATSLLGYRQGQESRPAW